MVYSDDDQLEGLAAIIEGACKVPTNPHPEFVEQACDALRQLLEGRDVEGVEVEQLIALFRRTILATRVRLIPADHGKMTFNAAVAWLCETSLGEKLRPAHVVKAMEQERIRERVRAEFNGANVPELAKRYGVHRVTIYRWLKKGKTGA